MLLTREKNERKMEKLMVFMFSMTKPHLAKSITDDGLIRKAITEFSATNFPSDATTDNHGQSEDNEANLPTEDFRDKEKIEVI